MDASCNSSPRKWTLASGRSRRVLVFSAAFARTASTDQRLDRATVRPRFSAVVACCVAPPSAIDGRVLVMILQQLIDEPPADATIADVQYRLYIIDAVRFKRPLPTEPSVRAPA
jgi:hypothetical protein